MSGTVAQTGLLLHYFCFLFFLFYRKKKKRERKKYLFILKVTGNEVHFVNGK